MANEVSEVPVNTKALMLIFSIDNFDLILRL